MLLTPGGFSPIVLFHPGLCGVDYSATSQRGSTLLAPQPIPIPQRHFSYLHVDLVGPLQYSDSFNYIFTIIDHTPNGWKLFQFLKRPQRHALKP
jgi:hypothetical protein